MHIPSVSPPSLHTYKWLLRVSIVVLVLVSLAAGYNQALYETEQKKYDKLEDMYVRVRSSLGREETQRIIDVSRQEEAN